MPKWRAQIEVFPHGGTARVAAQEECAPRFRSFDFESCDFEAATQIATHICAGVQSHDKVLRTAVLSVSRLGLSD